MRINLIIVRALNMAKNESETLFEHYCESKGIICRRIPEIETRTPDYEIVLLGKQVIVEVKEILPTQEEEESDRLRRQRGYGEAVCYTPGDRIRKKIKASSGQIKPRTLGKNPSILVLCYRGIHGHLDPYNIRVGMYGLEQLHIAIPPYGTGSPYSTGMGYGPKRKMTEEHNTSISAIGALFMPGPDQLVLYVYHNRFAQVPLESSLLAKHAIPQFELEDETPGTTAKWQEVVLADDP